MATKNIITQSDLEQFIGTENWYRHGLVRNVTFTDGVKFLAENAGAFWLVDEVAFAQHNKKVRGEEFQVWTLTRDVGELKSGATLTCDDGNGNVVFTKRIPFTDFPLAEIKLYFEGGVILLPSEH
jgi:hypothetical protein